MYKKLLLTCLLLWSSLGLTANNRYKISVDKILPPEFKGIILHQHNLIPSAKAGEILILPFSKSKFCRVEIEKVQAEMILARLRTCPHHLVKVGQRAIIQRPRSNSEKLMAAKKESQPLQKNSVGPIYILSTDLGSSTVMAEIPDRSFTVVNSWYQATSLMGATCRMKVTAVSEQVATLDGSTCAFERELQSDQELQAIKEK